MHHPIPSQPLGPEAQPIPPPQPHKRKPLRRIEVRPQLRRLSRIRRLNPQRLPPLRLRRQDPLALPPAARRPSAQATTPPPDLPETPFPPPANPRSQSLAPSSVSPYPPPLAPLALTLPVLPSRHSIQHFKLCPIPESRRPLKTLPRIHALPCPAHRAMQNTAVLHPLKSRIAIEQVLHHLPRIIKILLAQIDPQPSNTR